MNKATGGAQQPRDGGKKKSALSRSVSTASRQPGNRMSGQEFVRGVVLELKRVTWPTREEWVSATVLTIVLVVGIGLFTFACDWIFGQVFNWIHPLNIK